MLERLPPLTKRRLTLYWEVATTRESSMSLTLRVAAVTLSAALALSACGDNASNAAPAKQAKAAAPAARDWTQVFAATPEGGIRMGNPNAKVKLLEFASLTCPHCRVFQQEGMPAIKAKYVATGNVSYEFRPFILNGVDFAPSLLVRCQAPAGAFNLIEAFFDQQTNWVQPFTKPLSPEMQAKLGALPEEQQITAFAANGQLDTFVRTRGVTRAKFDQCTSDKAGIAKLNAIREDATKTYSLTGTPTFAINGTTAKDVADWGKLKPLLDAAVS